MQDSGRNRGRLQGDDTAAHLVPVPPVEWFSHWSKFSLISPAIAPILFHEKAIHYEDGLCRHGIHRSFSSLDSAAAGPRSDPAGHWEGAIVLPTGSLGVKVDLSRDEHHSWQGAIDIPAQGLHAFKLYPLSVNGGAIHFAMPGVAGEPQFSGQLVAAAGSITGKFAQSGQEFPFKLDRKEKLIADQSPAPAHGVAGKGLAGHWLGSLAVGPGMELRLTWEITTTASGERKGEMVSVDQGNARIPISALSEKGPGPPRGEEHRSNL